MKSSALLVTALGIGAFCGCYTRADDMSPAIVGASDGGAIDASLSGLPCDVADVLERNCVSCHGTPPAGGAQTSLDSRAALLAPYENSSSLAAEALGRMKSASSPMPPTSHLNDADLSVFSAWVAAGMPEGSCAAVAAPPAASAAVCTSGVYWTKGDDDGSKLMNPGQACITCHASSKGDGDDDDKHDHDDAPQFTAAGTLYPTHYEPDDCYGVGTLAPQVFIQGSDGVTQTLDVNAAGNFYTQQAIAMPYRAWVTVGNQTLTMPTTQTNGDCNSCHTANTSDPTGRIVSPQE